MKKLIISLIFLIPFISGCAKIDANLSINNNKSADIQVKKKTASRFTHKNVKHGAVLVSAASIMFCHDKDRSGRLLFQIMQKADQVLAAVLFLYDHAVSGLHLQVKVRIGLHLVLEVLVGIVSPAVPALCLKMILIEEDREIRPARLLQSFKILH